MDSYIVSNESIAFQILFYQIRFGSFDCHLGRASFPFLICVHSTYPIGFRSKCKLHPHALLIFIYRFLCHDTGVSVCSFIFFNSFYCFSFFLLLFYFSVLFAVSISNGTSLKTTLCVTFDSLGSDDYFKRM